MGAIARSRTESASRVGRARMLLAYREDASFFAVGRAVGAHHQTVQRCVERAQACGPLAALEDRPRPGREAMITADAKAWVVDLACRKAKELGYPHELWTTRRAHLEGDQGLARAAVGRPLRIHLHAQARFLAQSRRRLLFQTHPIGAAPYPRCIQTGAQGTASWPQWITSIESPSSTLGPISSTNRPDTIRISKSMN